MSIPGSIFCNPGSVPMHSGRIPQDNCNSLGHIFGYWMPTSLTLLTMRFSNKDNSRIELDKVKRRKRRHWKQFKKGYSNKYLTIPRNIIVCSFFSGLRSFCICWCMSCLDMVPLPFRDTSYLITNLCYHSCCPFNALSAIKLLSFIFMI